jgi:hypothetical protein
VIAAIAVAAALTSPSREALAERWLHANRSHSAASLESPARGSVPPPALGALAQRELAVPGRYRLTQTAPYPEQDPWWVQLLNWLGDRWRDLWRSLAGRVHVSAAQAEGFGDGLLAVVALGLLFVIYRILLNIRIARRTARVESEPIAPPLTARALYRRACAAASSGEYGEGVLLLFAATVALLGARGSATVNDLRCDLRGGRATLIPQFDAVAAPFVERAYAERRVDATQWNRAQASFAALLAACQPEPVER